MNKKQIKNIFKEIKKINLNNHKYLVGKFIRLCYKTNLKYIVYKKIKNAFVWNQIWKQVGYQIRDQIWTNLINYFR